ncbi:MAG: hypothetical protein ACRDTJ_15450 [Pseudonocardiaceae bacterium]
MTRRAVVAAAALVPPLAYEFAELARGREGWPYSRFVRLLPRPAIKALLITAFVVGWGHFLKSIAKEIS